MRILVFEVKYRVQVVNDEPQLVAIKTGKIFSVDVPTNIDGTPKIPNIKVSLENKVDGVFIPSTLFAPRFVPV